jgi:ParB-like chromosome segregation protein Spo0J
MRIIKDHSINGVKADRIPITPRTLDLIEFLRKGGTVPPIHVTPKHGYYSILDGRHRYTAFRLLGRKTIKIKYGVRINT